MYKNTAFDELKFNPAITAYLAASTIRISWSGYARLGLQFTTEHFSYWEIFLGTSWFFFNIVNLK